MRRACRLVVLALATLGPAAPVLGQTEAPLPSVPGVSQEPSPPPAPEPREAPTPAPGPISPGAEDATRPLPPSPAVPAPTPGTIFVPSPTVPSRTAPIVTLPGAPGAPATALFTLRPSITLSEEYSDNFFLTSNNREDNFRTVLTPGASLDINGAFLKGTIGYSPSVTHDSSSSDDINLFHSALAGVVWDPTPRLKLSLLESYIESDEPSRANRLSLRRERRTFTTNTLSLTSDLLLDRVATTAFYRWSIFSAEGSGDSPDDKTDSHTLGGSAGTTFLVNNSARLGYEYLRTDTEGENVDTGMSTSDKTRGHRFSATVERQLNVFTTGGITGSYAIRQRDGTNRFGATGDFDVWNVSLFSSYSTSRLTLSGSVGYGMVNRSSGEDESTFTTTSSLTYRFARAIASIGVESGFSETFAEGEDFGIVRTRGVTGSLSYPFTPAVSAIVRGYYRENEFSDSNGGSGDRKTTTWGAILGINVQLTRWLSLILDYAHTDTSSSGQDSTQASEDGLGRDYVENRARLSLRAAF